MKLNEKQIKKLWGETGPYSEVYLTMETRILDDKVSRVFIKVETAVNPFTFELVKKNRKIFQDDKIIQDLLDHSEFRGQADGYVSCSFIEEFTGDEVFQKANLAVEYSKNTIIKMHKFVLSNINEGN